MRVPIPDVTTVSDGEIMVYQMGKRSCLICCDCSLAHQIVFTPTAGGRHILVQVWRDESITRSLRAQLRSTKKRAR